MALLPTISECRGILGDPAFNFRWIVILPIDVASNMQSNYFGANFYSSSGFTSQVNVPFGRVENVSLPGLTIDFDARFGAAGKTHYPRFVDYESCSMSLFEDMNYNSLLYMRSWQNLIVDSNHNYYPPSNYKKTVYFFAFDPVNADAPTFIAELSGCAPQTAGSGLSYEYTSSGLVTIPVTMVVDEVNYHFSGGQNNLSTLTTILSDVSGTF